MMNTEKLNLTTQWDKTFEKSDKVLHSKVTFINRYGITLAADMYEPRITANTIRAGHIMKDPLTPMKDGM